MSHPRERLSAFLDDELPAAERAEMESHLRSCLDCARALEELAAVDQVARGLAVEAPAGYFDALPARVRARLRRPRRWIPAAALGAVAAGVLVAVLAPSLVLRARMAAPPVARVPSEQADSAAPPPQALPPATAAPPVAAGELAVPREEVAAGVVTGHHKTAAAPVPAKGEVAPRLAARERAEAATDALEKEAPTQTLRRDAAANGVAAPPPAAAAGAPAPPPVSKAASSPVAALAAEPEDKAVTGGFDAAAQSAGTTADTRAGLTAPRGKPPVPGRVNPPPDPARLAAERYQSLRDQRPATAADARALRDGWEAFVRDQPAGPHADEARVRAIEAGATAWRLGGDAVDLTRTRGAAEAYLAVGDAPQRARVRAVLDALPR